MNVRIGHVTGWHIAVILMGHMLVLVFPDFKEMDMSALVRQILLHPKIHSGPQKFRVGSEEIMLISIFSRQSRLSRSFSE